RRRRRGFSAAHGRTRDTKALRSAPDRRRAQNLGDGVDGLAPVPARARSVNENAKGRERVGRGASVAEEARTRLTRHPDRLMPLQRVDVVGGHRAPPIITSAGLGARPFGAASTQSAMASLRRTMSRDARWRPFGSHAPYACQLVGRAYR